MTRKTIHVPDDLQTRVEDHAEPFQSYSEFVREALKFYMEHHDASREESEPKM